MQREVKVSPAVKAEILRLLECVPRGLSADSLSKVAQIHRLDIEAGLVALGAGGAVASRIVVWRDDAASAQLVHQRRGDRRGARCGERYWQQPGQQLAAVSWREHAEAERLAQPVELLAPGLRPGGVGGERVGADADLLADEAVFPICATSRAILPVLWRDPRSSSSRRTGSRRSRTTISSRTD